MAKQLDKIIKVADEDYEINANNAVHAEAATKADYATEAGTATTATTATTADHAGAASKVDSALTITTLGVASSTDTVFDGSAAKAVSIVSSSGGAFSGKITVPAIEVNSVIQTPNTTKTEPGGSDIINYHDIKALTQQFTGSGWYTWSDHTYSAVEKNSVTQHLGIVVGNEDDLKNQGQGNGGFAMQNYYKKYLPMYIYLSKDTGSLFYGTSVSSAYTRLSDGEVTSDALLEHINQLQANTALLTELVYEEGETKKAVAALQADKLSGTVGDETKEYSVNELHGLETKVNAVVTLEDEDGDTAAKLNPDSITITAPPTGTYKQMYSGSFGIDMQNSDIIGINGLYFADASNEKHESINFVNTANNTNPRQTTYDRLYAADGKLYFAADKLITDNTTGNEIYHSGGVTIPVEKGGTGQTSLADVTVGQANKVKVTLGSTNSYANITISSNEPDSTAGSNGDIWIKY